MVHSTFHWKGSILYPNSLSLFRKQTIHAIYFTKNGKYIHFTNILLILYFRNRSTVLFTTERLYFLIPILPIYLDLLILRERGITFFCTHFISFQPPVKPLFVLTLFVMLTAITSFNFMSMVIFARCKVPAHSFVIFRTLHQMSRKPFLSNHMCFIIMAYY